MVLLACGCGYEYAHTHFTTCKLNAYEIRLAAMLMDHPVPLYADGPRPLFIEYIA